MKLKQRIKEEVLKYMHFGMPSLNQTCADELTEKINSHIDEKYDMREICHFFYHLGAADGIISSIGGKKTDFNERFGDWKRVFDNANKNNNDE